MKKSLYFASVAAVMFAACNEDFSDWAPAQSTTEGEATVAEGSVTALAPLSGSADTDRFQVLALNSAKGHITTNKLFLNDVEIPFAIQNDTVSVAKADLVEIARKSMFSMAAEERELAITGNWALLNDNGEATPLTIEPVKVKYTAAPLPANASEEAYYYVGGYNGWNLASPTKFENMGDGVFQLTINIGDSEWFAFAPQSAVDAGPEHGGWDMLFRAPSNGCTDTEGFLDNDPATGWSFCCEAGGQYTFILDMVNYTYKYIHYIEKEYYYIGQANGDTQTKAFPLTNGGNDPLENPVFTVTVPATGGWHWFKIAPGSGFNEDGTWNWDNEYTCACAVNSDDDAMSGKFVIGGDKYSWHILEDQYPAKFYRLSFNFLTQEYSITPINYSDYIYYAGDWTSWGDGKRELPLVDSDKGLYTGYYYIKAVDNATTYGFKFVDADGNWYGGGNGLLNGDSNCDPGEEGYYKIDVDWANMAYTLTKVTSITMVGSHNGWNQADANMHMTYNAEANTWEIDYTFAEAANVKFAMNDDWSISWGGANGDPTYFNNLTEYNGKDLSVAAGSYHVVLSLACEGKNAVTFTAM